MKHLITIAILVAAVALALAGYIMGFAVLFIAGVLLEGVFWFRIFQKRKSSPLHS